LDSGAIAPDAAMSKYLPRTWVSPTLVHGESKIHYDGVFTTVPVKKGEKLMEFGGALITRAESEEGPYRVRSIWAVADGMYLAIPESDTAPSLDENLNHSCDANAWLEGEVTLVARRPIAAGEEVTLDQGTWNHDEDEYVWDQDFCTCGAPACRKTLTHNDWRRADVRQAYCGHFHPFVQEMIDKG
jgi:hypothetical protein